MEYKCPNCETQYAYKHYEAITDKGSFCPSCAGGIIDAKSADLVKFGRHKSICPMSWSRTTWITTYGDAPRSCDKEQCGFDAAAVRK